MKTAQSPELALWRSAFWRREHHLDKMSFRELVVAYFQYPAIIAYLLAAAGSIGAFIWRPAPLVPTLLAIGVIPIGYAIGMPWDAGFGAAAAAFATGLITTCIYEFVHCIQHLAYKPRNKLLVEMKKRHMAHHFHDENGNYGITTFFWDKLFGTYYDRSERPAKSPTVFNLGYDEEAAKRWPKVAQLSGGVTTGHPRQRDKAA